MVRPEQGPQRDAAGERRDPESLSTAEHVDVILERVRTKKVGDGIVHESICAVIDRVGRIISKDSLTYSDAIELMSTRERLAQLDGIGYISTQETPQDHRMYGFLTGVRQLMDKVIEVKCSADV